MNRFRTLTLLSSLLLLLVPRSVTAAEPGRLEGLVLTVLPAQRQVVVRRVGVSATSDTTTLFDLAPDIAPAMLHAGDHIVAVVLPRISRPLLESVRVIPAAAPSSIVRLVTALQVGDRLPDTRFVDQQGHAWSFSDFIGQSVVLAFIYTRCQDAKECPLISAQFARLQTRFANGPYHLVEMTFDPNYDKPAVLERYAKRFGADPARWTFGTGNANAILDFDAKFGVEPFDDPVVGLIHTERTVLIGPNGKIVDYIDQASWSADDIIARMKAVDSPFANPLARLDFELSKVAVAICGNRVAGFSGLEDLTIVLFIFVVGGYFLLRVARKIFIEQV